MDSLDEGQDGHAEVRLNQGSKEGFLPSPIHVPRGVPQRVLPKAQAPAPIPGQLPEREKTGNFPVRVHADRIHAGPANDRHRICARGPGRQQREQVVVHQQAPLSPGFLGEGGPVIRDLHFQIQSGNVGADLRHRRAANCLFDQRVYCSDGLGQTDEMRTATFPVRPRHDVSETRGCQHLRF